MIPAIIGFAAAGVSALVAWLVARRTKSGKIVTTEAETLWREATAMRSELRAAATAAAAAHAQCEADLAVQRLATAALERRVRELEES